MAFAHRINMDRPGWDKRIRRADELRERTSPAHEVISFYRHILEVQRHICQDISAHPTAGAAVDGSLRERLDAKFATRWMPAVLDVVRQNGPAGLSAEAERIKAAGSTRQRQLLVEYLKDGDAADEAGCFVARMVWQPYAELLANQYKVSTTGSESTCPVCGDKPQLAVLRQEGDGGKRHLQCSFCLTEWEFRRVLCPACGEVEHTRLPRYSPDAPNAVRVEACETCKFYLKSFDMTADGLLVPEVDEIATIALDVWARGQGYRKIRSNVIGL